jgi:hypothetical protein
VQQVVEPRLAPAHPHPLETHPITHK